MLEIEFDGLEQIFNFPFIYRNNFPSVSQSVPILNLWWKSNPKIREHMRYLHTMKASLAWKILSFMLMYLGHSILTYCH